MSVTREGRGGWCVKHRTYIERVANALLERKTLQAEEIDALMGFERPPRTILSRLVGIACRKSLPCQTYFLALPYSLVGAHANKWLQRFI